MTTLNLSKNKLSWKGAETFSVHLKSMKALTNLDLSDNDVGDLGMISLAQGLKVSNVEVLDLSGNGIGKTSKQFEMAVMLGDYFKDNKSLERLSMNWSNLRGGFGLKILSGLKMVTRLKGLALANNLLGMSYEKNSPPVTFIAEIL